MSPDRERGHPRPARQPSRPPEPATADDEDRGHHSDLRDHDPCPAHRLPGRRATSRAATSTSRRTGSAREPSDPPWPIPERPSPARPRRVASSSSPPSAPAVRSSRPVSVARRQPRAWTAWRRAAARAADDSNGPHAHLRPTCRPAKRAVDLSLKGSAPQCPDGEVRNIRARAPARHGSSCGCDRRQPRAVPDRADRNRRGRRHRSARRALRPIHTRPRRRPT